MRKYISIIILIILTIAVLAIVFWRFQLAYSRMLNYEIPIEDILSDLAERRDSILNPDSEIDFADAKTINIIVLGLDGRKGQQNQHCDAIHMFQLNTENWSIDITSVPRGTYAHIPRNLPEHEYYLANACAYEGLEYGITQIERIVGVKADYYLTVGFSEVYGILRTLQLPTTESLQWLRHRQSYAIGDPQRSRNQAVFMKDILISQLNRFRSDTFRPMLFVIFNMMNTDMDFATARALFSGYLNSQIDQRPEDIRLRMKPYHEVTNIHFDFENASEQIQTMLRRIAPYLSDQDLSGRPLSSYQKELIDFIKQQTENEEDIDGIINSRLWLQIEDDEEREFWHYTFIEAKFNYLVQKGKLQKAEILITEYIVEKELFEQWSYFEKGKELLRSVVQ